jgi:hypothetical protein
MTKIPGSGSAPGSISQKHGSADPDPDPQQNVTDPQHWCKPISESSKALQNGDEELPEGQTGGRRVGSVDDAAH